MHPGGTFPGFRIQRKNDVAELAHRSGYVANRFIALEAHFENPAGYHFFNCQLRLYEGQRAQLVCDVEVVVYDVSHGSPRIFAQVTSVIAKPPKTNYICDELL
jgi:hypothetical protein